MRRNESNFIGLDQNWDEHAIAVLGIEYSVPKENQKDVTDAVRQFYFQDKPISMDETYFQLVEVSLTYRGSFLTFFIVEMVSAVHR